MHISEVESVIWFVVLSATLPYNSLLGSRG